LEFNIEFNPNFIRATRAQCGRAVRAPGAENDFCLFENIVESFYVVKFY